MGIDEQPTQRQLDERFMAAALAEARRAAQAGEVPVGAVIVWQGRVIARGANQREMLKDPTAHAEMLAITAAGDFLDCWRLTGCTLYVTLEPCVMCAGAIVNSRLDRLVYAAADPKAGACGSLYSVVTDARLNHRVEVVGGVRADEAAELLQQFFQQRRQDGRG